MQNQNQARKRGSKSAAVSQVQTTTLRAGELPDPSSITLHRAPDRRAGMVTILLQDKNGKPLQRFDMIDLLYNAVKTGGQGARLDLAAIPHHSPSESCALGRRWPRGRGRGPTDRVADQPRAPLRRGTRGVRRTATWIAYGGPMPGDTGSRMSNERRPSASSDSGVAAGSAALCLAEIGRSSRFRCH